MRSEKKTQANSLVNEEDKAFQSRYLLLSFDALDAQDDDPHLYSDWMQTRELLSALTPDFSTLLHNNKLDREAIQDCALFLQAAIGRKRDRNANLWGILLYFMLLINMMFQAGKEEQKEVFEWMVKSVTRSTYELNSCTSLLEQFVLHIHKMWMTHANPLGREHETLFFHNVRTDCSPNAAIFTTATSIKYYAFRVDHVCAVIKNVLGRSFSPVEIMRVADQTAWVVKGKAPFYDIITNSWPIANTVRDDETNANTLVPLTEDELCPAHLCEQKCIFMQQQKFREITDNVERGASVDVDYAKIEIKSANAAAGSYNFYDAVTQEGWYGYRAVASSTFGKYCGATNEMLITSATNEVQFVSEIENLNYNAGFGSVQEIYHPASLLKYYGYDFPAIDSLPPALKMLPFTMRNAMGDVQIDNEFPPWYDTYYATGEHEYKGYGEIHDKNTRSYVEWQKKWGLHSPKREDDEQSSGLGDPSPDRRTPGSTPQSALGLSNSPNGSSGRTPPLKRKARTIDFDQV